MPRQLSQEEFIVKAIDIHGERYDYSRTKYGKAKDKIEIICPCHGVFNQSASGHLCGKGCTKCGYLSLKNKRTSNIEEFIGKAKSVHGDKYDYSETQYKTNNTNVKITCHQHGGYFQTPANHLRGQGCRACGITCRANKKRSNSEEFIENAKAVHGDKYDYSKTKYILSTEHIIISCSEHGEYLQMPSNHLQGAGCPHCGQITRANKKRSSPEEFIRKAKAIHGEKYNYSKIDYDNNSTNVTIICHIHGDFQQTPGNHLSGQGCRMCGFDEIANKKRSNTEEFLVKAITVHGATYDYSRVEYMSAKETIEIICPIHGLFSQTPDQHLSGHGCVKCGINQTANRLRHNYEIFVEKAQETHGNRYDYSKVEYIDTNTKVCITCPLLGHGEYLQTPASHIHNGSGCPKCGGVFRKDTFYFIEQARKIHSDRYDYSKVNYTSAHDKITIICHEHGDFQQACNKHLGGQGCRKCSRFKGYSQISIDWLKYEQSKTDYIIQHAECEGGEHKILNSRYYADGYCEQSNTVFEFHGDYFHGNPKLYLPDMYNKLCKKTMGELHEQTMKKKQHILVQGYKYVEMWEYDWLKAIQGVIIIQQMWRKVLRERLYISHTYAKIE